MALPRAGLYAQDEFSNASSPPPKRAVNFPAIKEISPGVLQVGGVTLDRNTRTVTFPGTLNMDHGDLEYLLVGDGGKTHESLLATKVEPYHLHTAMLLLGAKPPKPASNSAPPDAIDNQYLKSAPKPQGDPVSIRVRWKEGDKDVEVNAEDLIYDSATKAPMTRGPWIYNGSLLSGGVFLAQQERSFAALVIDPSALINNTRPGCDNDQIWSVAPRKAPKSGTPVEIVLQLQTDTKSTTSPTP